MKKYIEAELKIIEFPANENVITTSGVNDGTKEDALNDIFTFGVGGVSL